MFLIATTFFYFTDGSSEENSEVLSVIQPLTYGLELVRSGITFPGKDVLENAIGDYSQQVSELQKQLSEVSVRYSPIFLLLSW